MWEIHSLVEDLILEFKCNISSYMSSMYSKISFQKQKIIGFVWNQKRPRIVTGDWALLGMVSRFLASRAKNWMRHRNKVVEEQFISGPEQQRMAKEGKSTLQSVWSGPLNKGKAQKAQRAWTGKDLEFLSFCSLEWAVPFRLWDPLIDTCDWQEAITSSF